MIVKRYCLLILVCFAFFLKVEAQNVNYDIEPSINEVLTSHISVWSSIKKVSGYRIQLVALAGTNSRNTAQSVQKEFSRSFPDIPSYLSYAEPNFRVRVGNFRTRLDALRVLESIKMQYPGAFIVSDKVNYTDI